MDADVTPLPKAAIYPTGPCILVYRPEAKEEMEHAAFKQTNFALLLPAVCLPESLFSLPDHKNFYAGKNCSNSACHCYPKCCIVS